ncbi:MAG: PTS sugar transporter subunit IIA [Chitinivibrionales bacterium]|nr:PTS sugar transporter subunit IIA [Chitinivibrionales bacterium]
MRLLDIINGNLVIPELKAREKYEAISEMVDHLVMNHEIRMIDRAIVLDAVYERERSMSTGMTDGVAIPHGSTNAVEDIIGVLGISRVGLPFESLDGKNTRIICLLIYPQNTFRQHVRTLAGIARLMSQEDFREKLLGARSEDEIIAIIEKTEGMSA